MNLWHLSLESEWRQGAVLPQELLQGGNLPASVTLDAKLVVLSHDCDIVNDSYIAEPFVEFFVARPRSNDARDGRMFNGKSPRRLQLIAAQKEGNCLYEIDVYERHRVDRRLLEADARDATIRISARYRLILRVVVPAETCEDDSSEYRATSVVSEMNKLLAQCKGITVEDARLVTESEITLDEVRSMNRWDFDYLSPEEQKKIE